MFGLRGVVLMARVRVLERVLEGLEGGNSAPYKGRGGSGRGGA